MIPLLLGCIVGGCLDVPIDTRPIHRQIIEDQLTSKPVVESNPWGLSLTMKRMTATGGMTDEQSRIQSPRSEGSRSPQSGSGVPGYLDEEWELVVVREELREAGHVPDVWAADIGETMTDMSVEEWEAQNIEYVEGAPHELSAIFMDER